MTRIIDVHHHFIPDEYRVELIRSGNGKPDGMPSVPEWSELRALDFLDEAGIDVALLSISTPGVLLDGCSAVDLAKLTNNSAAGLIERNPERFGAFATLPLPDVDESLREIDRSLGELRFDGVTLLTHYGERYLGDRSFDPVFEELNRRGATVFLHPTSPIGCECTSLGFPRPFLEFMFDTTRTVANLIYSGTLDDFPAIDWIVPHAGAALPILSSRIEQIRHVAPDTCAAIEPVAHYLSRCYYDLAGSRPTGALSALTDMVDPAQLLFGSDWPFTPAARAAGGIESLALTTELTDEQIDGAFHRNATRLFPRLGGDAR